MNFFKVTLVVAQRAICQFLYRIPALRRKTLWRSGLLSKLIPAGEIVLGMTGHKLIINPKKMQQHRTWYLTSQFGGARDQFSLDFFGQIAKEGWTVVDIGSHAGIYAVLAASKVGRFGRVLAIEPDPENFHWLNRNLHLNGCTNVSAFQIALGNDEGEADLWLSRYSGEHSLIPNIDVEADSIKVPVSTLDSFLDEYPRMDMIKIDVEGFERAVLEGARNVLADAGLKVILCELHHKQFPEQFSDSEAIIKILLDYDFEIYRLGDDLSVYHMFSSLDPDLISTEVIIAVTKEYSNDGLFESIVHQE